METTLGIKHVFIIFCDKPFYKEAITKLFEVNKDHRNNLVLLVGLPRRQREVSEKIRAEYPNMKFDSSTNGYEAFTYLRSAIRRAWGKCIISPICSPQYGARLMQIFTLMQDIQNIKLRQYNKNVEFMFYSISSKDHTSAFITKHFYSSQRGIMFAKKCAKWLRIARFNKQRERIVAELNKNYKH